MEKKGEEDAETVKIRKYRERHKEEEGERKREKGEIDL